MRNIDLTGKLGLEPKPTITIGDTVLTVDDSAPTILRILEIIGNDPQAVSAVGLGEAARILFTPKSYKALEKMGLSFGDFALVISSAMELVMGSAEGEAVTPATT